MSLQPTTANPDPRSNTPVAVVSVPDDSDFRPSPFSDRTIPLSRTRKWAHWPPFLIVDTFTSVEEEISALRSGVVVADQSPLVHTVVQGPDAGRLMDRLATRDITKLEVGQAYYTPFVDHDGKVVCDGPVTRHSEDEYSMSSGPLRGWALGNADGLDVAVSERSAAQRGILCPQGPKSREVLEAAAGRDCGDVKFSRETTVTIAGHQLTVLRQGFTGELGYELHVPVEAANEVWDAIWEAGNAHGIRALGHASLLVARVEAGLLLGERDYNSASGMPGFKLDADGDSHHVSPYELDFDRFVDLTKPDFIGKDALVAEQASGGAKRRFVGLEYDVDAMRDFVGKALYDDSARLAFPDFPELHSEQAFPVQVDGDSAGFATSFVWSPTLHRNISFARIDKSHARIGAVVDVDIATNGGNSHSVPARIVEYSFVRDRRRG